MKNVNNDVSFGHLHTYEDVIVAVMRRGVLRYIAVAYLNLKHFSLAELPNTIGSANAHFIQYTYIIH